MPAASRSKTLTIIVPALNEEAKIADTVNAILPLANEHLDDFEVILVDDGSTDRTGAIMDELQTRDPRVVVIHHDERRGLGFATKEVTGIAKFEFLLLIPGDDAYRHDGIAKMFRAVGAADVVIAYRDNQSDRSLTRSFQSHALRFFLNTLFGFGLFDYHGVPIYPVKWLRRISVEANGYGFQISALVSLLQLGLSYVQVPVSLNAELKGSSRAMRPRTYFELCQSIILLLRRAPIRHIDASQVPAQTERGRR